MKANESEILFQSERYKYRYKTPIGFSDLMMSSDGKHLTGLRFTDSTLTLTDNYDDDLPIFRETREWLDIYFQGKEPNFTPKYKIDGATPFRKEVLTTVSKIPFGATLTYGEIGDMIARKRNMKKMSPQAIGGAVGSNPICIIIPCHRVIGAKGNLTGYAGGMNNKIALLKNENVDISRLFLKNNKK